MSWIEELKKEREEFWNQKINDIRDIIYETVKSHQETREYALTQYGFVVFARKVESSYIQVCFKIGDEDVEIARFQDEDATIVGALKLAEELQKEGFDIVSMENEKVDFSDAKDHILCDGVIPID